MIIIKQFLLPNLANNCFVVTLPFSIFNFSFFLFFKCYFFCFCYVFICLLCIYLSLIQLHCNVYGRNGCVQLSYQPLHLASIVLYYFTCILSTVTYYDDANKTILFLRQPLGLTLSTAKSTHFLINTLSFFHSSQSYQDVKAHKLMLTL